MKEHKKKLIAPIIVTAIMVLYYVAYFGFLIALIPMELQMTTINA